MDTVREEEGEEEEEEAEEAEYPEDHSPGDWGQNGVFQTVSTHKIRKHDVSNLIRVSSSVSFNRSGPQTHLVTHQFLTTCVITLK